MKFTKIETRITWIITFLNILLFLLNILLLKKVDFNNYTDNLNSGLGIVVIVLFFSIANIGSLIVLGIITIIKLIITFSNKKRISMLIISFIEFILALIVALAFLYAFASFNIMEFIINSALIVINNIVGIIMLIALNKKYKRVIE